MPAVPWMVGGNDGANMMQRAYEPQGENDHTSKQKG